MNKQDIVIHIAVRKNSFWNRYVNIFADKHCVFTTKLTLNEVEEKIEEAIESALLTENSNEVEE